ncbi:class I SAM-dependent methyltransferase [Devosia beringensis]|uniref:class I SAM-dependent methyltransferase n=1 Tax=Devosia beringensis TaxID=2657486 RepID=UPI00186B5EF5|nr:class I SAM-dependent methyltransferase [Devosia beringensis]
MTAALYPADFYQNRRGHTAHAASRLLAALPAGLPRASIADLGCGTGTWLAAALASGSRTALGVEGAWVTQAMLDDPRIDFVAHDLEQPFAGPRVDLALSLEVAEHLSPARADSFVADLVALAPAVLFSAAIPGQGGVGHINEQWQSWWAAHFAAHGYTAHDLIRTAIWADDAIPAWYRQNAVLYLDAATTTALGLTPTDPALLDTVHPAFWSRANRELAFANALPESEVLRRQAEAAQQQ